MKFEEYGILILFILVSSLLFACYLVVCFLKKRHDEDRLRFKKEKEEFGDV